MDQARARMAGDGINDAPALAAAHVGIAMGLNSFSVIGNALRLRSVNLDPRIPSGGVAEP